MASKIIGIFNKRLYEFYLFFNHFLLKLLLLLTGTVLLLIVNVLITIFFPSNVFFSLVMSVLYMVYVWVYISVVKCLEPNYRTDGVEIIVHYRTLLLTITLSRK